MTEPLAFLSYTRKDNEFFGGYITAFRRALENAVHVVSGEEQFRIFQDVDGIVIGENWQKKLDEVINKSSFLVPMLSPLFFNSQPCRYEVCQFLEHERALHRDDLILPVYFFDSPKLEKDEERAKDPMAKMLTEREMFDWRQQADVPLDQTAGRKAILKLADGIVQAMKRLDKPPVRSENKVATVSAALELEAFAADPRLGEGIAPQTKREKLSPRTLLWVDDNPANNSWERRALESYGMRFLLALDTDEAERLVADKGPFAAIISDMSRVGDPVAGYTLLGRLRKLESNTPYFVYTTTGVAEKLAPLALEQGIQGITGDPDVLVEMVVATIRRT
jgi:CheY-like chemotaxis protein